MNTREISILFFGSGAFIFKSRIVTAWWTFFFTQKYQPNILLTIHYILNILFI